MKLFKKFSCLLNVSWKLLFKSCYYRVLLFLYNLLLLSIGFISWNIWTFFSLNLSKFFYSIDKMSDSIFYMIHYKIHNKKDRNFSTINKISLNMFIPNRIDLSLPKEYKNNCDWFRNSSLPFSFPQLHRNMLR